MRVFLIVTLYNFLNVTRAQFAIINEDIGDLHLHAEVGNLPLRYTPLSNQDQKASEKAADVIDFIQLVPYIDPLVIPVIHALDIDFPFLWLSGKVYLENFSLYGVKQLQLNDIDLRLITLRSDLNVTIPQLYFEVDFNVRATMSFMPIKFSCHISANLFDVGVIISSGGYTTHSPSAGEVIQVESVAVKLDIGTVVFNLTNMVMGKELDDYNEDYYQDDSLATQNNLHKTGATSGKQDDNVLNGLLRTAIGIANSELFKVSFNVFRDYLLSDSY